MGDISTIYGGFYTVSSTDYSWFGYESPVSDDDFKFGQGAYGWRNFKRFLKSIPEIVPVARVFEKLVRPLFMMRSHPRWSSRCWKAKT